MANTSLQDRTALVSVGMPVYNGELHLRCALDSLLQQSYRNLDIVISDNASTDGTPGICLEYAKRDGRIRFYRNACNLGPTANFNRVFELAKGDYFMWAAHDDRWESDYISRCLCEFNRSERLVLVGSAAANIQPDTEVAFAVNSGCSTIGLTAPPRFRTYMGSLEGNNTNSIFCGIYRRDQLQRVMPLEKIMAADHLLLAELSLIGEFYTIPDVLMHKRFGGASRNIEHLARALGIDNRWHARYPYFFRAARLQKIIFRRQSLSVLQKVYLSLWLWGKWVELVQKRFLCRVFTRGWSFGLKAAILARLQETRLRVRR